jgi:superfamily II RNA helicase
VSLLYDKVPFLADGATEDDVLTAFLAHVERQGLTLYPAQEEAILELVADRHVILATPTGSGKSLVALFAHFLALAQGERSIYTAPIKALANEKFFALSRDFGKDNVGLLTGDASINPGAPILCATAEILASMALREGANADLGHVIMDEFHYYSDKDRGVSWQVPLLQLPHVRFLLMSATLGDVTLFEKDIEARTGAKVSTVRSDDRPVPLHFDYRDTPLHETLQKLVDGGKAPIYLVNFTQRGAAEEAQNLMSVDFCSKEEKKAIHEAAIGTRFDSPFGKDVQRYVRHGIGLHHAGLLPKYRLLVEKLAQRGLLKVISGTDTLGVGVNVPIRTVVFTKLCKYDGEKTAILTVRDFKQIAGRAGRRGFDTEGLVVAQAPEHVIENLRMEAKAAGDPKKLRKMVRRKPPEKGFVPWDKAMFEKLVASRPEALVSRFSVSHGMLLDVVTREGGGCMEMARLVKSSHERLPEKRKIARHAASLYKSLLDAKVLVLEPRDDGEPENFGRTGSYPALASELQLDFALNQPLALYLLETLPNLAPELDTHALDILSVVESICENPEPILMRQLDKAKELKMAEMKMAGVPFEERIAELEKVELFVPIREFSYTTYNAFRVIHPWVIAHNVKPKSIARDMIEQVLSFNEYVREYGLERTEGLLLRYLTEVYKTLVQSVPDAQKTPALDEVVAYLGGMVRQADSSLLDEWEKMRDPAYFDALQKRDEHALEEATAAHTGPFDITRDVASFTALVRNASFALVRALARHDLATARTLFDNAELDEPAIGASLEAIVADHGRLREDAEARSPKHLAIEKGDFVWDLRQALVGDEGPTGYVIHAKVDLEGSRVEGHVVLRVVSLSS